MATPTAAQKAAAQAAATATIHTATTQDVDWGNGAGSFPNVAAASARFSGQINDAPAPLRGESSTHYLDRVIGGDWTPGTGAMGWVNGIAEQLTGDMFSAVAGALEDVANDVDPSGTVASAIKSVNANVQAGLSTDERLNAAQTSDAADYAGTSTASTTKGSTVATASPALYFQAGPTIAAGSAQAKSLGAAFAALNVSKAAAAAKPPQAPAATVVPAKTFLGLSVPEIGLGAIAAGGLFFFGRKLF
jgi:hypothetical protein